MNRAGTAPSVYSFIIPCYNEEAVLEELFARVGAVLDDLDGPAEVLCVDDGSTDRTYDLLYAQHCRDSRWKLIRLSRNFGHQVAVTAGLDAAEGDAVIILDADLQDPPELVHDLIARWREGYEVVYAVRRHRQGDSVLKRASAALFYRLLRRLTEMEIPLNTGDFRLVDRRVAEAVRAMPEHHRFLRGLFAWVGFRQSGVEFDRPRRHAGTSKYPFRRMLRLAFDGILGFSTVPLRVTLHLGLLVAIASFLYGVLAIILKLGPFRTEPGWASLMVVLTFLGGVQLVAIGIIGLYIVRVTDEVRCRPIYIVRDVHGLDDRNPG